MRTRGTYEAVPVQIRGVVYPSQLAAGKALGVNQRTISRALDEGWLDRVGLIKRRPVSVTIDGVCYPSMQSAARGSGMSYSAIQERHAKGLL